MKKILSNRRNKTYKIEDPYNKGEVIVSWIITHACQEKCAYCISPLKTTELKTETEHFLIQNKLIEDGLTKIRYIGGEPLIIPHLDKLIEDAHSRELNTRLSTNGVLLTEKRFEKIKDHVDSIALPFESPNDELNKKIRGKLPHREIISSRIAMIKKAGNIGVLINTCVHKENIGYLEEAGSLLAEHGIDHWKLRRFNFASGRGAVPNKDRFYVSDEEFFDIVNKLKEKYPDLKINGRLPSKLETRLMVSPQGNLYRMLESEEKNIQYGNLLYSKINIKIISEENSCN